MTIETTSQTINKLISFLKLLADKWWGMLVLSFIPFLIILFPLVFNQKVFFRGDLVNWVYPIYQFYQASLNSGQSILWNPYNLSGFPSFISSMGFLSPLHYLFFKFLPLFIAYNLLILLNASLSLFFTWQLLKKFKLSLSAGFFGGLVYVFSQWAWIHDITVFSALPLLPLLFLIIYRGFRQKDKWSVLFGGLIIGWAFLSVHFNWLIMILSAGFLFSLYLGWQNDRKWVLPLRFVLMFLIGLVIGSLILLPLFAYNALSSRGGLSYSEVAGGALNIGDFLRFILPYFNVSVFNFASSGSQLYMGILPLFFFIFAIAFRSALNRFFITLFFICLFISIKYSPLFWLMHQVPGFDSLRGPQRWMFIAGFCAAVLSGLGLDYFLSGQKSRWSLRLINLFKWLSWLAILFLGLATFVFYFFRGRIIDLAQGYFDRYLYSNTSGLPLAYYHWVIEKLFEEIRRAFSLLNPQTGLVVFFLIISYAFLSLFYKIKLNKNYFAGLVILVVLLNLFSVFIFYHPAVSADDFYKESRSAAFIKEEIKKNDSLSANRIFAFLPGFSEYSKLTIPYQASAIDSFNFQKEIISPNLNIFYDLKSIDSYDNLMPRRMSRILALIGSDRATFGAKLADLKITPEGKVKKLEERKKLLDLLGARYILSVFPLNEKIFPQLLRIDTLPYNISMSVYENREARPLFYFASQVEIIEPDEETAYEKLLSYNLEGRNTLMECVGCPAKSGFENSGEIAVVEKNNTFIRLKINSPSDNYLVFSESYLPGWHAYIDNQETKIYQANNVYMGVFTVKGSHEIIFKYSYPWP